MKRLAFLFAIVMCGASALRAQIPAHPNFAGTWVFDAEASQASAVEAKMAPAQLFTQQFVVEQTAAAMTMKIDLGTMVVTAIYNLNGAVSKNMSPPAVPNSPDIEVTSTAKWVANTLVIDSSSQSPSANGPVDVQSTRKFWLDAKGRLVIERVGTPVSSVPKTRSVYTRK